MNISFDKIGDLTATFANRDAVHGDVVTMYSSKTVTAGTNGSAFIGVCTDTEGGKATVQLRGFATVEYTGEPVAMGIKKVVCAGNGKIRLATAEDLDAREVLVAEYDSINHTATVLL